MPELPEVETITRDLEPELTGRTIVGVTTWPAAGIVDVSPDEFRQRLIGQIIHQVRRRAKYLLLGLGSEEWLAVHLAMTGTFTLADGITSAKGRDEADPAVRCIFSLDDGRRIVFRDPRGFGRLRILDSTQLRALDERLGPEPLDQAFTPDVLAARLRGKRSPIKTLLLDQAIVSGLGNIYADEALHQAEIHPLRKAVSLSEAEIRALHAAIRQVLGEGIRDRGTTFSDFRDGLGRSGTHQQNLRVYQRTKKPCPQCQTPIERITVGGRASHFCPRCQPENPPEGH